MPSTFSTNLHLELQATGENAGMWGQILDLNVFNIIDAVLGNVFTLPLTNVDVTLSTSQTQNNVILLTGTLTGNVNVIFPQIGRTYYVMNATSGAFSVILKTSASGGAVFAIPQGASSFAILDGTNVYSSEATAMAPDYLSGLITTRVSALQVSVAAGKIKVGNRFVTNLASIAKNINTAWAAGNNVGGFLDTGSYAANGTYFLQALRKIADGSFDWGWSASLVPPVVPSGYEWAGRFWANVIDGASNIRDYTQSGNKCVYTTPVLELSNSSGLAKSLLTCTSAPAGISVDLIISVNSATTNINPSSAQGVFYDGYLPAGPNSSSLTNTVFCTAISTGVNQTLIGDVRSNTAKQVYVSTSYGGGGGAVTASVQGWYDYQLPRNGA